MTLVSYIRLGKGAGIACSDGEFTYSGENSDRTYSIPGRKLRRIGTSHSFVGIAGDSEFGRRIMEVTHKRAKAEKLEYEHPETLGRLLQSAYAAVRSEIIKNSELDPMQASWADYREGRLSRELNAKIDVLLKDPKIMDVSILFGGAQKPRKGEAVDNEFYLFRLDPPGILAYPRGFDIIGNDDMAEPVISDFMEKAPISGEIPLQDAARVLLAAKLRAQKRNPGVGGNSRLVWVKDGRYRELDRPYTCILEAALFCYENCFFFNEQAIDQLFSIATSGTAGSSRKLLEHVKPYVDKEKLLELFFTGNLER